MTRISVSILFIGLCLACFLSGCSRANDILEEPAVVQPGQQETKAIETPFIPSERGGLSQPYEEEVVLPTSEQQEQGPSERWDEVSTAEGTLPEDPVYWTLGEVLPDPDNPSFVLYILDEKQAEIALRPIKDFFNAMYYSDQLLTFERASQWIDTTSQAWNDPEMGFKASHDSFAAVGYYPHYEFPLEDSAHFTAWEVYGMGSPQESLVVLVKFRLEEQTFTVYNQETGEIIVTNPYWGPRLAAFQTAYRDGQWKIIFRQEENLGEVITSSP